MTEPKSWQQQYKEKYEAKLGRRMYGNYTITVTQVIPDNAFELKWPDIADYPGVGQISRDDYEVQ